MYSSLLSLLTRHNLISTKILFLFTTSTIVFNLKGWQCRPIVESSHASAFYCWTMRRKAQRCQAWCCHFADCLCLTATRPGASPPRESPNQIPFYSRPPSALRAESHCITTHQHVSPSPSSDTPCPLRNIHSFPLIITLNRNIVEEFFLCRLVWWKDATTARPINNEARIGPSCGRVRTKKHGLQHNARGTVQRRKV